MENYLKKFLSLLMVMTLTVSQTAVTVIADDGEEGIQEETTSETLENEPEEAEELPEETVPEEDSIDEPSESNEEETAVDYVETEKGLKALAVHGKAAEDFNEAAAAIAEKTDLSFGAAQAEAKELLEGEGDEGEEVPEYPSSDSGNSIDVLTVKWLTADSEPDEDPSTLYYKPADDNRQNVRMRINYTISGTDDIEAGAITIRIPASIFKTRTGADTGNMEIPFPEAPSEKNDFNWILSGDSYVLTNTKTISASTAGYIDIGIYDLVPHTLVDMEESAPFNAYMEIQTQEGTIAKNSNDITAQFDTDAVLNSATKRPYNAVNIVPASEVGKEDGEYVKVDWYTWANIKSNTVYTLKFEDSIPDEFNGFIVGDSVKTLDERSASGDTPYVLFSTAYPISEFEENQTYTFTNNLKVTLTEKDSGEEHVVETSATKGWKYQKPEWVNPQGNFNVFKNGNDGSANSYRTNKDRRVYSDGHLGNDGFYGIYPGLLNKLQKGEEIELSYTVNTVSYHMIDTYKEIIPASEEVDDPHRIIGNYFQLPVKLVTQDDGVNLQRGGEKLVPGEDGDYEFASLEFMDPYVYTGVPKNVNEDGTWVPKTYDDGTFEYVRDNNKENWPDITVEITKDNETWTEYATVSWETGGLRIVESDGTDVIGPVLELPSGTVNWRTSVESINAAYNYDVRPTVRIFPSEKIKDLVETEFEESSGTPSMLFYNHAKMDLYDWDEEDDSFVLVGSVPNDKIPYKDGYDLVTGYTTDTKVLPSKKASYTRADINYDDRYVTVHYEGRVEIRSMISDKASYDQAIADGSVPAERECTWYDLLPIGMVPQLDTIKLRSGDRILDVYTVDNYKGSGRTLLVVKARLTPKPTAVKENGIDFYEDVPQINFDARYYFDSLSDYGEDTHNIIAYESGNDSIGTIENYKGEPDDPHAGNNQATARAFISEEEKTAMTDLDPKTDDPKFVYAGAPLKLDILMANRTSLNKDVMVNNDGYYASGANDDRIVYANGQYTYRLRMMSNDETISKNLILFDSLEDYEADEDADYGNGTWQGTLTGVDVSQLIEKGCAPVVYYSTKNLALSAPGDDKTPDETNTDITNRSVWTPASEYTGDIGDVKAIAVDARKKADGTNFELMPLESISVYVNMAAPYGDDVDGYIEENAHAYNDAYMFCTSVDAESGEGDADSFVHKPYTKTGITSYDIEVVKAWDDDNDRDGARPDAVTVHLMADGEDAGREEAVLSEDNEWSFTFTQLPYVNAEGERIHYTVEEDAVAMYKVDFTNRDTKITVNNRHEPSLKDITGTKTWRNDDPSIRPASITVRLYADGEYVRQQVVKPDEFGSWSYVFKDVYEYTDHGKEIEYTIEERITASNGESYIAEEENFNLVNIYHPFGDLKVTKNIVDVTDVSAENEFTFTFVFTKDGEPVFDTDYEYDVLDENGDVIEDESGTVTTNGTVTIKGGQTIHVKEIEEGTKYTVSEEDVPGFTMDSSSNLSGTIKPNAAAEAAVTNKYSATGRLSVVAQKKLYNSQIKRGQFTFSIAQVTTDEEGNETRTVLKQVLNGAETGKDEDGASLADVNFGSFYYTQEDAGKTFVYEITEVDQGKAGYTYDENVYTLKVTVTDNGDGTLTIDQDYGEADKAVLTNTYEAEGELDIVAWKELKGRTLKADEFTFVLLDEEGKLIETKTNDENGTVSFTPQKFDQSSIGKTYRYAIAELTGTDPTVNYVKDVYGYEVTVFDNGNGTLSFSQVPCDPKVTAAEEAVYEIDDCETCGGTGKITPEAEEGEEPEEETCPDCNGTGKVFKGFTVVGWSGSEEESSLPVFTNILEPGSFSISKLIDNPEEADPDQEFRFKVKLIGEGIEDIKELNYKVEQITPSSEDAGDDADSTEPQEPEITPEDEDEDNNDSNDSTGALNTLKSLFITTVNAAEYPEPYIAEGTSGTCSWVIDADGVLHVFPTDGVSGTLASATSSTSERAPWTPERANVKKVIVEDGVKTSTGCYRLFAGFSNCTEMNVSKLDTSGATDMQYMFASNSKLTTLTLGDLDTSNVTNMYGMFENMEAIYSLNVSGLDTENVTNMGEMFAWCKKVRSLDLRNFNTSNVTSMTYMFCDCVAMTSLNVSSFDTSKVTNMSVMFSMCEALTSLDVSNFNTSNVRDMNRMFSYLRKCKKLDLSNFDTSNVTNMQEMFSISEGLTSINVSGWDTRKVTNMSQMFSGCTSLPSLDLSSFETPSLTNMSEMFRRTTALTTLDISNFNTSKVTGMSGLFSGDTVLKRVYLSPYMTKWNSNGALNTPNTRTSTGKWMPEDEEKLIPSKTPEELCAEYPENAEAWAGWWIWEPLPTDYTIKFAGGEGTTGAMPDVKPQANQAYTLPANQFAKPSYVFDHWDDGNNNTYADKGTIPAYKYAAGTTVTLTAVFKEPSADVEDGEFEIILHGFEKATFDDIPAGTAYQIYEETPDGWVLIEQTNTSGIIEPMKESEATFTNRYQPDTTAVRFYGTKMMDNSAAKAEQFRFELRDANGALVESTPNMEGGFIQFAPIEYKKDATAKYPQTYKYTITEVQGKDNTIDYDSHVEEVTVTIDVKDGKLTSSVEYDEDGIKFFNKTFPGALRITKNGQTDEVNKDDEFTFKITFTNPSGLPIGDDGAIEWYVEPAPQSGEEDTAGGTGNGLPLISSPVSVRNMIGTGIRLNDEDVPEELEGYAYAVLTADGDLILFRSNEVYENAATGTFEDIKGNTYTGTVYAGIESSSSAKWPKASVKTFRVADGQTIKPQTASIMWFNSCLNMTSADLRGLDTSNLTSMYQMFYSSRKLSDLNVSELDTSNVTNMYEMFASVDSLRTVDVSGFDTSKVTNMEEMFFNSNIQTLDLSSWDTSAVTNMQRMFWICEELESVNLSGFETQNVTNMENMFSNCLKLKTLDLSSFDTSNVKDMSGMFNYCPKLESIEFGDNYNTSSVTTMRSMFSASPKLTDVDVSRFDTSNVTDMSYMFSECAGLTSIDVSNFNTSKVTNMSSMFNNCTGLTDLDVTNFDTSKTKYMYQMFRGCKGLTSLDVSNFNTSSVTDMSYMFYGCTGLTSLDLSNFNTSEVTNMGNMFYYCTGLTSLDLSNFNTSKVTNMGNMFGYCTSLEFLDISNFDLGKIGSYSSSYARIFSNDNVLKAIVLSPKFKFIRNGTDNNYLPDIRRTAVYTGYWINADGSLRYTSQELGENYTADLAGLWVWETSDVSVISFNGNGGYANVPDEIVPNSQAESTRITMPSATRPGYFLTGWSKTKTGDPVFEEGKSYSFREVYGDGDLSGTVILYAQWVKGYDRHYYVDHMVMNDAGGYTKRDTERFTVTLREETDTAVVTPAVKTYEGYMSPEPEEVEITEEDQRITYYYDRASYTVEFDGNEATSGQMNPQKMFPGINAELSLNNYQKTGSIFTGWNTKADGSGTAYVDGAAVRDLAEVGETVTLYAQWMDNDNPPIEPTGGSITVKCKAGETIVLPNLPAGTNYTVEEIDIPDGWTKTEEENTSGTIVSNETARANVTNEYNANGEAEIVVYKTLTGGELLENGELKEGRFTFELVEGDEVVMTAENGELEYFDAEGEELETPRAAVTFALAYEMEDVGEHNYFIREVIDEADTAVDYDTVEYVATVVVKDEGKGVLSTEVGYGDVDELVFHNVYKTGELEIEKIISDPKAAEQADPATAFTFEVKLTDKLDKELTDYSGVKVVDPDDPENPKPLADDHRVKLTLADVLKGKKITLTGLPAGTVYTISEVDIPNNWSLEAEGNSKGSADSSEPVKVSFTNKYEKEPFTDLIIEKELDSYEDGSDVTFVFDVKVELNGETVLANVYSLTFDGPGKKSITLTDLPSDAIATVTEVYAGAGYKVSGEATAEIQLDPDADENKVSFTNTYSGERRRGYGAQNTYTEEDGIWNWKSDLNDPADPEKGGAGND